MNDLLDASVWVPLCGPDHVHHERARRYWETEAAPRVAFCRVTALALLRHLTNPHIMQHAVQTGAAAWDTYDALACPARDRVSPGPPELHHQLRKLSRSVNLGPALWTDAYLAAFAMTGGCRLVAFDAGFRRFPGLDFLHLTS